MKSHRTSNARMVLGPQPRRRLAGAAALVFLLPGLIPALAANDAAARVELVCKLVPADRDRVYELWNIELRKASGELLRNELKGTGDKARFRNLEPGIYMLCIRGDLNREHCESVDLTPPSGKESHRFSKQVEVPKTSSNHPEHFRVSARSLRVPKQARNELLRADAAQLHGDSQESLKHLERALEIFPDYPEALNNLGVRHLRQGDHSQAIRYFQHATEIEPDFYQGWLNLGGSLLATGQFSAALEANKHAHRLRSNDALANSKLAINYYYLHDFDEAVKYFKRVQEIDPLSAVSPQLFLAHIAFARKHNSEAEEYIRSYLELHPNSPQAPRLRETLGRLMTKGSVTPGALDIPAGP